MTPNSLEAAVDRNVDQAAGCTRLVGTTRPSSWASPELAALSATARRVRSAVRVARPGGAGRESAHRQEHPRLGPDALSQLRKEIGTMIAPRTLPRNIRVSNGRSARRSAQRHRRIARLPETDRRAPDSFEDTAHHDGFDRRWPPPPRRGSARSILGRRVGRAYPKAAVNTSSQRVATAT